MYDGIAMLVLRRRLTEMIDQIAAEGSRLLILRNGRSVAALVPATDMHGLEKAGEAQHEAAGHLPQWDRPRHRDGSAGR